MFHELKYFLEKLCCKITDHKLRKIRAVSKGITPIEYYYTCCICGHHFWNYNPPTEKQKTKWYREYENGNRTQISD